MGTHAEFCSSGRPNEGSLRPKAAISRLAPIEQVILLGLANGESSKLLADVLEIPLADVEGYKAAAMTKLDAASTADAVRIALVAGIDRLVDRTNPR